MIESGNTTSQVNERVGGQSYDVLLQQVLDQRQVFWSLVLLLGEKQHLGVTQVRHQLLQQ